MPERTRTSIAPPRLASLAIQRDQLAHSSRANVFVLDGTRLLRSWGSPARPWVIAIEPRGERWAIEAWGAGPHAARAAARAMFSLDHPIEQFYRLVAREPVLRGTERRFRGLRITRDASLYEALLHAVLGQQLSVHVATTLARRLADATDAVLSAGRIDVPRVPAPRRVAALGPHGLRALGISHAKSRALIGLAGSVHRLARLESTLGRAPLPLAIERLEDLPGVGRWTAENSLLRGLGRRDVFVAGDLGLRVALADAGAIPRSAPEAVARAWGERHYAGWGSYATLYLWRKLVAARAAGSAG